jgi:hypothetical protein
MQITKTLEKTLEKTIIETLQKVDYYLTAAENCTDPARQDKLLSQARRHMAAVKRLETRSKYIT